MSRSSWNVAAAARCGVPGKARETRAFPASSRRRYARTAPFVFFAITSPKVIFGAFGGALSSFSSQGLGKCTTAQERVRLACFAFVAA